MKLRLFFGVAAVIFVFVGVFRAVVIGGAQRGDLRPAEFLGFRVFARPLGVWCDDTARFVVGLSNQGAKTVHVGVPRRPDTRFPYMVSTSWADTNNLSDFRRGAGKGTGMGCVDCGTVIDCDMCAKPDMVTSLAQGTELAWTLELPKSRLSLWQEGAVMFRLTMNWYGAASADDAARQKLTGSVDVALIISRISDHCFSVTSKAQANKLLQPTRRDDALLASTGE